MALWFSGAIFALRSMVQPADSLDSHRVMPEKTPVPIDSTRERRQHDRRQPSLRGIVIGGSGRTRRRGPRRASDHHGYYVDWYETRLFAVSLAIVLLCCTDALLTLTLLERGAEEVNLFMAHLIEQGIRTFVSIKLAITVVGLLVLVAHSTFRLLGFVRVRHILYGILASYMVLFVYQLELLSRI
jgi:hypothetical protein